MSDVVVFSPSRLSFSTICVTELLLRKEIHVRAIIVKRLFNPKRFWSEFGRDGARLPKKIWKKLVLRDKAYNDTDYETIVDFMKKEKIFFKSVDDFKRQSNIPVIYCYDINSPEVVKTLQRINPDLVVFTGGGLIRKNVLENSGDGILNCHMGTLPRYRGMDVVEWPLLEDQPEQVGMTVHFMDHGIDTGDILRKKYVPTASIETIKELRDRFEPIMVQHLVETCCDYLNGQIERSPQKQEDGRQYFIMHPRLIEIAKTRLKNRCDSQSRTDQHG